MQILKIEEPYWSAWQAFGWEKGIPGVGISSGFVGEAMRLKSNIYLYVGKDVNLYRIDPYEVYRIASRYNSTKMVGKFTRVMIVPMSSLQVV